MVAPVIPALNDSEIERILDAAAHAGVKEASYVLLRLPLEVRDLFREWLMANLSRPLPPRLHPDPRHARRARLRLRKWGTRMKGTGPMAWMIGRRFEIACEKLGLNKRRLKLTTDHFVKPNAQRTATEFVLKHRGIVVALGAPGEAIHVSREWIACRLRSLQ